MRFTELLTNGFRSSFEIPEVCYEHVVVDQIVNVNFMRNFVGELRSSSPAKFAQTSSVVGLIIMNTNEFKHSCYLLGLWHGKLNVLIQITPNLYKCAVVVL